jgi:hypothetical protein
MGPGDGHRVYVIFLDDVMKFAINSIARSLNGFICAERSDLRLHFSHLRARAKIISTFMRLDLGQICSI